MKKLIVSLVFALAAVYNVSAMSYPEAAEQARYLTDKMAYELNLNDQQYNDCYEINLDYLLSVETADDAYGNYLAYRNADLRHILLDWQFTLFAATDYFFHPLYWRAGAWYYPVYRRYAPGYFYYSHPTVYWSYRGGHGRFHYHSGYYVARRPHWQGGFRGHDRSPVVIHESHRGGHAGSYRGRSYDDHRGGGSDNHRGGSSDNYRGRSSDNHRGGSSDNYRGGSDNQRGSGYRFENSGRSGRLSNSDAGYQHPSSTRTTVHSSASSESASGRSYSIGGGRSSSVGASSSSSMGAGRSSSMGASRSQSVSSRGGAATRSASPSSAPAGSNHGGSRRGGR